MPALTISAASPAAATSATASAEDFYPYELPLTFEITHGDGHELSSVKELIVTVQREGDEHTHTIVGAVNPFTAENGCTRPMPAGISACVVSGDRSVGTLRVNWQVPQAGRYRIVVSVQREKHERETLVVFTLDTVA